MFDIMPNPTLSCGTYNTTARADLFVNGEHTAADEMTRKIICQLLEEIGVLKDAKLGLVGTNQGPKLDKRAAAKVEKQVCFMASFLRTASKVERFGILMDRHRWTETPCGYTEARAITEALLNCGYILRVVRPRRGRSSVYRCSEVFRGRLTRDWGLLSFKRARPHPIEVREPKRDYLGSFKKRRLPLGDFPSNELRRQKKMVIELNAHLSTYPVVDAQGRPVDTTLRRIFTGNLRNGGRLYGDYQNMPEEDRLRCTIDGEPVCEIDLKASHVAILAALFEHPVRLPQDPYAAVEWVGASRSHRKAAKTIVQCMVHADGGMPKRFPRQNGGVPFKAKYGLEAHKIADLLPAILEVMPFLEGSPRLTLTLQYIEAEILTAVLRRCCFQAIPALPIHDSLLVKRSDEREVLKLLKETLRDFLGPHAPWLDVSIAEADPRLVEPLSCSMDEAYQLRGYLKCIEGDLVGYEEIAVSGLIDDGDFRQL